MHGTPSHSPDERDALRRAQRMESVGRLAAGLAHDFNNLLTAIRGYTGFLLADLPDGPSRSDVEQIQRVTDRAVLLTRQLVMLGRRPVSQPTRLDPFGVLEALRELLPAAVGEDMELSWELDGPRALVHMDRAELEQVVIDLVLEARDAMPAGGPLRIALARRSDAGDGTRVVLQVEDARSDATGAPGEAGDGFRLATVREIVGEAGGTVDVARAEGGGWRVVVSLPALADGTEAPGEKSEAARPRRSGPGGTVLLVEDDEQVRGVVRRTLEQSGYRVLEAADGTAAIRAAGAVPELDLVLTDAVLPGLSGAELADRIRAEHPAVPVLVMSGHTLEMAALRRIEARRLPLLNKPFDPEDLLTRVHLLVAGERPQ